MADSTENDAEVQQAPSQRDAESHDSDPNAQGPKPILQPDGTHIFPIVEVAIPAHGINGSGAGEITWHPERGLRIHVEATSAERFSGLEAILANFTQPQKQSAGAGAVFEPSRDPQLVARVSGTGHTVHVYQLAANVEKQSQSGPQGFAVKLVISGMAVAATVGVERDSDLSFWHESVGSRRLLIPDLNMYQWPTEEKAEWTSNGTYRSALRFSCPLSESPKLTLFSASVLPQKRKACWLTFEPDLIPVGERDWFTPNDCLAANSLLSFLCGKRLPYLWIDRFHEESYLTRTYFGTVKVDDLPNASLGYQPAPLNSLEHGTTVVEALPSMFATYRTLRQWFDLDWIVGPLWYAVTAYLDDKLGLASVSLERYASALNTYLDENPEERRPKVRFLGKAQFRALRRELLDAVEVFAKERAIDLTHSRLSAVDSVIGSAVDAIAKLDDTLFPEDALNDLRGRMKDAVKRADESGKLNLDTTKATIIDKRIDTFAQKTNPDKLVEALEFDGVSVSDIELEAVMKRNDCLHGRRTLLDSGSLSEVDIEVARFDTLRTLINKVMLARLGYRGLYVDFAKRPPQRNFPVRNLQEEMTTYASEE